MCILHTHTRAHAQAQAQAYTNIHHSYEWKQSDNNISLFLTSFPFRSVSFRYFLFLFFSFTCSLACFRSFFLSNSIHVLRHDSCWSHGFSHPCRLLCLYIRTSNIYIYIPHDRSLMCSSSPLLRVNVTTCRNVLTFLADFFFFVFVCVLVYIIHVVVVVVVAIISLFLSPEFIFSPFFLHTVDTIRDAVVCYYCFLL